MATGGALNGWQRAALLVGGLAVAIGTINTADTDNGMAWIIGALIATGLVVVGLKGITAGRGPVLAVIAVATLVGLAGLGIAFAMKLQALNEERETEKKAIAEKASADQVRFEQALRFADCTPRAALSVMRSNLKSTDCAKTLLAEFERERASREDKFIADEQAAGRDVTTYWKIVQRQRSREASAGE